VSGGGAAAATTPEDEVRLAKALFAQRLAATQADAAAASAAVPLAASEAEGAAAAAEPLPPPLLPGSCIQCNAVLAPTDVGCAQQRCATCCAKKPTARGARCHVHSQ
jgi:hypothetical protein